MNNDKLPPIHPGEILLEEFLQPLGVSQNQLAHNMCVSRHKINSIIRGKHRVTGEIAIRLGLVFKNTPEFWLNLQSKYDLEKARDEIEDLAIKEVIPLIM